MKNFNWTYIITALILSTGIVGYGLINYNQTKLVTQGQQAKKVVEVIKPTIQPIPTVKPTLTPIPTLTESQYLDEVVTLHNCKTGQAVQLKRSDLPKYGYSVDYIPGSRICPASPPQTVIYEQPLQTNTTCSTMGSFTNCTSTTQ